MKTSYQQFIEANNNLTKCFESVSFEQYSAYSQAQKDGLCKAERQAVSSFLSGGQIGFANLIKERLEAAGHQ